MRTFVLVIMMLFACATQANNEGRGKLTMSGQIIASACAISTDDIWQEIDFGTVPLRDLTNNKSLSKRFSIHLINCTFEKEKGGKWKSVNITFDGPSEASDPAIFSMSGEGTGVGLTIADEQGNKAIAGKSLPDVLLNANNTDLNFTLNLVRNGETLSTGDVSSFLRFMVAYQ